MIYYIVLYNILFKTNSFIPIVKAKAILSLIEPINIKKSLETDVFEKRNLTDINKTTKILSRNDNTIIPNIKYIIFKKNIYYLQLVKIRNLIYLK